LLVPSVALWSRLVKLDGQPGHPDRGDGASMMKGGHGSPWRCTPVRPRRRIRRGTWLPHRGRRLSLAGVRATSERPRRQASCHPSAFGHRRPPKGQEWSPTAEAWLTPRPPRSASRWDSPTIVRLRHDICYWHDTPALTAITSRSRPGRAGLKTQDDGARFPSLEGAPS